MAIAHVQHAHGVVNSGGPAVSSKAASAITVTSGNLLLGWAISPVPPATITFSDDKSNTWVQIASFIDEGYRRHTLAYANNCAAGSTIVTASWSGSTENCVVIVHEVSGQDTSSPVDVSRSPTDGFILASGTSANACTTGDMTTTVDGAYIAAFAWNINVSEDYAAGTNFTRRVNGSTTDTGLNPSYASESMVQTSAGAIAGTFTLTNGTGRDYIAAVALKPAGGGASAVPVLMQMYHEG